VALSSDLTQKPAMAGEEVPLGRPINGVVAYILDRYMEPMPVGVTGELFLGGAGLARGYVEQPSLTAQRFVPHPFSQLPGSRLYRTGDLARYRPDASIEFVGRLDDQVKIRGFRIEPAEVLTKLIEHPIVQDAVVISREDIPGNIYLAAYIVAQGEHNTIRNELRNFLQQNLPDYMIPAAIVVLEALPKTPSGKLDRHALPLPDRERAKPENTFVAARTLSEELLVDIWLEVLGVEQIGIYDNFFELGGHSMLAIQLMARVQNAFQIELSLRLFFEKPTIAETALAIDDLLLEEIENVSEEEALLLLEGHY
jgi:acyl-CoA synthetase (AMP-forming)/AMP-acid ligase II